MIVIKYLTLFFGFVFNDLYYKQDCIDVSIPRNTQSYLHNCFETSDVSDVPEVHLLVPLMTVACQRYIVIPEVW